MSRTKTKYSVSKVVSKNGVLIGYLSSRDIEHGMDINMDMQGYIVVAL